MMTDEPVTEPVRVGAFVQPRAERKPSEAREKALARQAEKRED